jgi:hypothetical protein
MYWNWISPRRYMNRVFAIFFLLLMIATSAFADTFGPVISWPIIPIHVVLLPNGQVLSYGTDQGGNQGAQFLYDVWDTSVGTGDDAHFLLPNTTQTDIFCSGQSVMAQTGGVL